MSKETVTIKVNVFKCDMCPVEQRTKPTDDDNNPFDVVEINGHNYDLCFDCYNRLMPSLEFLATYIGMDIKFKVVKVI